MFDVQQHGGVYQEAADRWIQALGGPDAVERAAIQRDGRAAIAALSKDHRFVRPPSTPEWDAVV